MTTTPEDLQAGSAGPQSRVSPAQILLMVAGLLLVLGLVWFFFLRADEAEEVAAPVPVTQETPAEEETVAAPDKEDPVETFEVFAPKDPFDPLISASAGVGGTSTGTTTAGTTTITPGDGGTTTTSDGTGTTTTTTTTSSGGDGSESVGGHRVRVVDVFVESGEPRAQVQVDATVYTVDEGERFAQNFRLLSTSGRCATMLFGDDEFTLCEGEEILK